MRIKLLVFAIIVIILFINNTYITDEEVPKLPLIVNQTKPQTEYNSINNKIRKQATIQSPDILDFYSNSNKSHVLSKVDALYLELGQAKYSTQPTIELVSIMQELEGCKDIEFYDSYAKRKTFKQLSDNQLNYLQLFKSKCNNTKSQYPIISQNYKSKSAKEIFMPILENSSYANLVTQANLYNKMPQAEKEKFRYKVVKTILHHRNSQLLLFFSKIIKEDGFVRQTLGLPQLLGSINDKYIKFVARDAAIYLACENNKGVSCSPNGYYMTQLCLKRERACGIDVELWIFARHTASSNRDLMKVVNSYKSFGYTK